jgi:hypothetical protein
MQKPLFYDVYTVSGNGMPSTRIIILNEDGTHVPALLTKYLTDKGYEFSVERTLEGDRVSEISSKRTNAEFLRALDLLSKV